MHAFKISQVRFGQYRGLTFSKDISLNETFYSGSHRPLSGKALRRILNPLNQSQLLKEIAETIAEPVELCVEKPKQAHTPAITIRINGQEYGHLSTYNHLGHNTFTQIEKHVVAQVELGIEAFKRQKARLQELQSYVDSIQTTISKLKSELKGVSRVSPDYRDIQTVLNHYQAAYKVLTQKKD